MSTKTCVTGNNFILHEALAAVYHGRVALLVNACNWRSFSIVSLACKNEAGGSWGQEMQNRVYYLHYVNRYNVYDSVVNSILNRTFKIRKI